MTAFEILDIIESLCDINDVTVEINTFGIIIRKYFYFNDKPYRFNKAYNIEVFKYKTISDCFIDFEKSLEIELYKGEKENE